MPRSTAATLSLVGLSLAALLTGAPAAAQALDVQIAIDEDAAAQAGITDTTALRSALESEVDGTLVLDDQAAYLSQMADANILSAKGMGVDYASNFEKFIVGGGFGSAVNSAGFRFGSGDAPLPTGGFAFQATVMAGLNLGFAAEDDSFSRRVRVYANGLIGSTSQEPFAGDLLNYGGHLQLKLIRPSGEKGAVVRFAGLDLTSGYEFSRYTMRLDQGLPIPADDASWNATGSYVITSEATSVPIELSTGLKIAIISVYGGGGVDVNPYGQATSTIGLEGPLEAEHTSTGETLNIGTAAVQANTTGQSALVTPRIFAGAMAHLMFVKLYGHLNVSFDRSVGGHIGARIAL
jgi:hypothetical protein